MPTTLTPYLKENGVTLYNGDALETLRQLPSESVHCCITSPPYWGLRDYGVDGQLGLERTPEEYVSKIVQFFRELRRVLRSDGTLWLNLGDSYSSGGRDSYGTFQPGTKQATQPAIKEATRPPMPEGLKPKDLCGIPWRVAFALQADGWYLRSEIIWSKPNPMPESVTDRPTKSHEQIFLLAKSERYFFDNEAVKESTTGNAHSRGNGVNPKSTDGVAGREKQNASWSAAVTETASSRNVRSVWTFGTEPYKGAHFATFPRELVRRCVRAGTSEHGVCDACGSPWTRIVESQPQKRETEYVGKHSGTHKQSGGRRLLAAVKAARESGGDHDNPFPPKKTVGWQPSCKCESGVVPATVSDCFAGTCTVGVVCRKEGCQFIGIELNEEYCKLSKRRLQQRSLLV